MRRAASLLVALLCSATRTGADPLPLEWALNPQTPCAADSLVLVFHGHFPIWDQGSIYDPFYVANRDSFARVARAGADRVVVRTVYRPDRHGSSEVGSFGVPVGLGRLAAGPRHFTIEHHRLVQWLDGSLDSSVVEVPLDVEVADGCVAAPRPIVDLPWIDSVSWEPIDACAWKPLTLVVRGSFNNGCPRVLLAAPDDSAHARMVIRMKASARNVGCTDDVPRWTQRIAMGLPGPGMHHIELGSVQLGYNYQWPPAPQERSTGVLDVPVTPTCGDLPMRAALPGVAGIGVLDAGACSDPPISGTGIPVAIRGEFPSGCSHVERVELLPNPLGSAPPLVRVKIVQDEASCTDVVTPWCAETRIPSLPAGRYALIVQVASSAGVELPGDDLPTDAFVFDVPRTLAGAGGGEGTVGVGPGSIAAWSVEGPWPNPSRGRIWTRLSTRGTESGRVTVHDVAGRVVRVVHEGALPAGDHVFFWDGRSEDGSPARGGIYFLRVRMGDRVVTRRTVMLGRSD